MISRFRSPKQQKEILQKTEAGKIDILIGTHRLISKDVKFADLGPAWWWTKNSASAVRHQGTF